MVTDEEWSAVFLTVQVSLVAVMLSLPVAVGVAWTLAKRSFWGKSLCECLVNLPLVLPPVVTGYLLLTLFGRQGIIGDWLYSTFGLRLVFDWKGAAVASAVVGFPLLVRPIRQAFDGIDNRLLQAGETLGATKFDLFFSLALPLAYPGLVSGTVLAFARSMGEFGATVMIAGNIPGETQTVPLFIYSMLDGPQGIASATRLVVISVIISAVALLVSQQMERRVHRFDRR